MMPRMRTTVTLDDDLAARLQRAARERGVPFKEVLNEALRRGLDSKRVARRYRIRPRKMQLRAGVDLDKALRLSAELEDAETVRRLELRK
jgi:hypothetical protein